MNIICFCIKYYLHFTFCIKCGGKKVGIIQVKHKEAYCFSSNILVLEWSIVQRRDCLKGIPCPICKATFQKKKHCSDANIPHIIFHMHTMKVCMYLWSTLITECTFKTHSKLKDGQWDVTSVSRIIGMWYFISPHSVYYHAFSTEIHR